MTDRILVFVPAYNCERQIGRVVAQLDAEVLPHVREMIVVDNGSTDGTRDAAARALAQLPIKTRLFRNDANYGLGGSHKVAFNYALDHEYDYVVVLHGDDQGSIHDLIPLLKSGAHRGLDALLGARFMTGSRLEGYSKVRTLGNHVFNAMYSLVSGTRITDLGSGLNLYRVGALASRFWMKNANDLTFNYHMILRSIDAGWKMKFFPLTWREADQVSNVKLVKQSLRVASLPLAYAFNRAGYRETDYSGRGSSAYPSTVIFENHPG